MNTTRFTDGCPMKTIVIGIPTGQATRDVVHSGILAALLESPEVRVVLATPAVEEVSAFVREHGDRVTVEPTPYYKPTLCERLLRSVYWSSLYYKCGSIRNNISSGRMGWLVALVNVLQRAVGPDRFGRWLDAINQRVGRTSTCGEILRRHAPDLVVLSRVFNFSADYPLLKAAVQQQIPTIALVSSWDNLTTKGFFPFGVDEIAVWNEVMRQEAIDLFDFPTDKIHVLGVPRFDHCFRRTHVGDRATFLRSLGLDPAKKTITYTTANRGLLDNPAVGISPEVEIIRFLAEQAARNTWGEPVQVLARLHPLADLADYRSLTESEHLRLYHPGRATSFRDRLLDVREEEVLVNTLVHSDVVLNIASTITIDAAIFDTPVVCVAFDWFGDNQPFRYSVKRFYNQDHYKKIATTGGYRAVTDPDDLIRSVQSYLADPELDRGGRAEIVRQQCHFSDGRSAERVATLLLKKVHAVCRRATAA